jgi:hypothetical protein
MFLMHGRAKYMDVLERTLYNAVLSGVSMEGDTFFYPNVLESHGQHARSPWFGCSCCPSNIARFIPSVPGLAYAHKNDDLYVNLFIGGAVTVDTADIRVMLSQETAYPWEGAVAITVDPESEAEFTVNVRIPGWSQNQPVPGDLYSFADDTDQRVVIQVNGKQTALNIEKGYARITRRWSKGDTIEVDFPMPIRRVLAHPNVETNAGRVALQRGPIVYCIEGPDNEGEVFDLVIPDDAELTSYFDEELLGGIVTVAGQAETAKRTLDGHVVPDSTRPFKAIPYYAWSHRGGAQMTVWPASVPEAARPKPADTLAYLSKTTASFVHVSLDAIKDQILPANSADASVLQLDFWPHEGTTEWVMFEWDKKHEISSVDAYWFDDTGRGACRVPKSWRVLYRESDGTFRPMDNVGPYGRVMDAFNEVSFKPVSTSAIKIEIVLQDEWAAGIQEVVIR